ncbi:uncharacterized protein LOC131043732 isoform X1 [Cryptomeria japonica]|uniref:uncharacterized protein LOC131043732 isoform X1 n=1 Tax=Cryptomeria japonica TaxID=3369 RepID=UPI0025AC38E7|nr:uncharacterized protein LOC131043732 isoform X1 [Cryptomeria japonica]
MRGEGFEYVDNNSSIHVDWHLKSSNFIKEAQKQKPFDANRVADIDNDHDELVDKNVQHNHSCVEVESNYMKEKMKKKTLLIELSAKLHNFRTMLTLIMPNLRSMCMIFIGVAVLNLR